MHLKHFLKVQIIRIFLHRQPGRALDSIDIRHVMCA